MPTSALALFGDKFWLTGVSVETHILSNDSTPTGNDQFGRAGSRIVECLNLTSFADKRGTGQANPRAMNLKYEQLVCCNDKNGTCDVILPEEAKASP